MKHRKQHDCPGCYPEKAEFIQKRHNQRLGGYQPAPRCPSHARLVRLPPVGPGAATKARP